MKQVQIVLGIVLTLALCYGGVLASGGFEAGDRNVTAGVEPVAAGGASVSQTIVNETNATGDVTVDETGEPEIWIVNSVTGVFNTVIQNVVKTSSSGGSPHSSSSGGRSSSNGFSGGTTVPPTATETPCPTTDPTTTSTVKVTATSSTNGATIPAPTTSPTATTTATPTATTTSAPTATTEPTPESTPTATPTIDPTPTPTPEKEITIETWTGTAGVTRTYYYIVDHATQTTSVIVESEFPPELADMMSMELHDYVYHFSNIELKNIYLHFYNRNGGPNGEDYGGPTLETRFGYYDWLMKWNYPLTESVILIYSEDVPVYVISTVDFAQYSFMRNPYTGEQDYIPRKYYDKKAVMPEKQPGIPRYYALPVSAPIRLYREGRPDNPYLTPTPTPTGYPTAIPTLTDPTAPPTAIETPSPAGTSVPQPTPVQHLTPRPTATSLRDGLEPPEDRTPPPTVPPATPSATPESTPVEEPTAEPTVEEPTLEETPTFTQEPTEELVKELESAEEPVEEQTPVEDESETG